MLRSRVPFFALVGLVAALGCGGPKGVNVSGKITPPSGVKWVDTDNIEVRFVPDDPKAKSASATFPAKDPSFSLKDVPPGKYKVAVTITPYAGEKDSDKRKRALDPVNKKFDEAATKLQFEVPGGSGANSTISVTVDLAKETVTKS